MAKTNVLVVEDESIVSKDIQHSLKKLGYNVVGAASTGERAFELASSEKPDIILMDIMLKGDINGIEVASRVKEELQIPVIYLTAYADESTLEKAKVTEPYGYIIKPFKEVDLHTSIEMALYKFSKEKEVLKARDLFYSIIENKDSKDFIFVKSKSRLVKIKTIDIYFVEALKDYVVINTLDSRYTIHSTMKDIVAKLEQDNFIRVHRSFIVRLDKIASIEYPNLHLEKDKKIIPIGGSFKDDLIKKLNLI
ncbi:MAG: DNA-binding LytR/AlgR family response regulator [Arenicella sp.]|jgi:DNA-binding LytR/AlgR family response regulator